MSTSEEEFLLKNNKTKVPFFDAPDGKILAFDMFRGPSPGFFSDMDLNNPGEKIIDKEELTD
ncbi:hypothetical protein [Niallia endozanthoxylica]|uniref:Uncharacterized protein n=1 Tax=Niallia endozanthoxylica TaxID=2036016 RepID=A0A5J5GWN0_9BACI|nr:hypothetical protein [Niallia endozanthoxylica]KAA9012660.1 hypothetical protein F4V44_25240 [Niallia endozanthoxylica]